MEYLRLFIIFFKTGLFTIGGGLASLPILKEALVDGGLISQSEFIDMIAISQSTPGPIGINMATYAGYKIASVFGGIVATAGMVAPSLIIIILIAAWMKNYASSSLVVRIMAVIRPAALGLIASAAWFIFQKALLTGTEDYYSIILFIVLLIIYKFKPSYPVFYIISGGIIGLLIY